MFAVGVWIYVRSTRARDAIGHWALVGLIALMVVAYVANIVAGPPPGLDALWIGALAGAAILMALAWWADAHREPV